MVIVRFEHFEQNDAGQTFWQVGLANCQLNNSLPAGTTLAVPFSVIYPGRPDLNATVNRTILIVCPQGVCDSKPAVSVLWPHCLGRTQRTNCWQTEASHGLSPWQDPATTLLASHGLSQVARQLARITRRDLAESSRALQAGHTTAMAPARQRPAMQPAPCHLQPCRQCSTQLKQWQLYGITSWCCDLGRLHLLH